MNRICHCSLEGTACLTCNKAAYFTGGWGSKFGLYWQEDSLQKTLDWLKANKQREDKKVSKLKVVDRTKESKEALFEDLEVGEVFVFVVNYAWVTNKELLVKISSDEAFNLQTYVVTGSIDKSNGVIRKECELVVKR